MNEELDFGGAESNPNFLLFYDTETTGLPDFRKPADDPSQPRMCSLAVMVTDLAGTTINGLATLIRPDGWIIGESATAIHGITTEACRQFGVPCLHALSVFEAWLARAERRIAHNVSFDNKILRGELRRFGLPDHYDKAKDYCTMHKSRDLCRIPPTGKMMATGRKSYKLPSLDEAYRHFFGKSLQNAHTALGDVKACRDIYFAINSPTGENVKAGDAA